MHTLHATCGGKLLPLLFAKNVTYYKQSVEDNIPLYCLPNFGVTLLIQ